WFFDLDSWVVLTRVSRDAAWPDGAEVPGSIVVKVDSIRRELDGSFVGVDRFVRMRPDGRPEEYMNPRPNVWMLVFSGGAPGSGARDGDGDDIPPNGSAAAAPAGGSGTAARSTTSADADEEFIFREAHVDVEMAGAGFGQDSGVKETGAGLDDYRVVA